MLAKPSSHCIWAGIVCAGIALLLAATAVPAAAQVSLSEIRIDQPSDDNDEYFEFAGSPGASLDTFTYVVIGDGSGGSGTIENVTSLSGQSVPASGFFVAAEGTFSLGTADLVTGLDFENSDNVTHLLVQGFTGALGDDLDTDDDGLLDVAPWGLLVDCVALIETPGSGDRTYCATTVGPDGSFAPGHVYFCPGGWEIGDFGAGVHDTPGAANACGPVVPVAVIHEILQNPAAVNDSAGEWFEVFNPTATPFDLDGWTIQDNDIDSHVIANGGPLVLPAGGFLVLGNNGDSLTNGGVAVDYVYSGIALANGADELVLLDTDLNEIDRVEWDDGLTFPDPNGASMALSDPALDNNVGANWCTASTPFGDGDFGTPGAANDCDDGGGDDDRPLVINEIDYDQPGTDGAEFLEIKNVGDEPVSLGGVQVVLVNGNGNSIYQQINLPAVDLAAGDYFVVCGDAAAVVGCDLDVSPDSNLIQNGSPDAAALRVGETILDAVSYEGSVAAPFVEGSGSGLEDPGSGGVGGPNENKGISRFPDGVDTDVNNADFSTRCITPGKENTADFENCPAPERAPLVINEIDYDQPGTDADEFIELKNVSPAPLDLSEFTLELVNGNGGAVYRTIPLPAVLLAPGDYFVVCGDPSHFFTCDLDGGPNTNLIQNGSPDAVAVLRDGEVIDAVSYEGDTVAPYTEGSGTGLEDDPGVVSAGISRFPDGFDTDRNNVDLSLRCSTPGLPNTAFSAGCAQDGDALGIFDIQGSGFTSPFVGQTVTTRGNVVTGITVDGFFLQTPTADTDGDAQTSDGIFVFTDTPFGVEVGQVVDLTGEVVEFFDLTEIGSNPLIAVVGTGAPLPAPVPLDTTFPSPLPPGGDLERVEGMLARLEDGLVTGATNQFGETSVVAGDARAFREKGIEFPGLPDLPVWDGNPEIFEIDADGLVGQPNPLIDALTEIVVAEGPVFFTFGDYQIMPSTLTLGAMPDPLVPVRAAGADELTVGSLNLFRLFDDIDDPGSEDNGQVVSTAEYQRRLEKFSAYIRGSLRSPDILAVQEAESLTVLEDLVLRIATDDPAVTYTAFLVEGNDIGGIDVGFLVRDRVRVDAVTQLAANELLSVDDSLLHDRPPLLLEGALLTGAEDFDIAVMVVHNRSLNGIDNPSDGPRVRQKRLEQAQSIATLVQDFQTTSPEAFLTVVGDFNAFQFTDGYVDAVGQIRGDFDPSENLLSGPDLVDPNLTDQVLSLPPEERYSFVFDGSAQVLDHALTTVTLDPLVTGFEYGRGNADAANDRIFDLTARRSSDHDGLVLFVFADTDNDGVANSVDVCPGTEIPEAVPTQSLGINRWALVDGDTVFDTQVPPGGGPGVSFTTEDTGGCSCAQIIEEQGLGFGHTRFGCSTGEMEAWVELVNP